MSKKLTVFILLNLLLIIGSLSVGVYVRSAARRYFTPDVLYIAPLLNHEHLRFNTGEMEVIRRSFPDYTFAPASRSWANISTGAQWVNTYVVYCDAFYFGMQFMDFTDGWHWYAPENIDVIVLNEDLAWRLFGARDIVGLTVQVNGRPHMVVGVVRLGRYQSEYLAWMPRDIANEPLPVSALFLTMGRYNPLAMSHAHSMLMYVGRNSDDYAIVDISRYIESIGVRHRVLLYVIWLVVLVFAVRRGRGYIARIRDLSFDGIRERDFRPLIGLGILLGAVACGVYIVFGVRDLLVWLPNFSFITLFESVSNIGVMPPVGYLSYGLSRLYWFNGIGNYAWIAGVVGLVNTVAVLPWEIE